VYSVASSGLFLVSVQIKYFLFRISSN